jgi:hypothetical protein
MRRWGDRVRGALQRLRAEDRGLVTLEWVLLTSGVFVAAVGLAVLLMNETTEGALRVYTRFDALVPP